MGFSRQEYWSGLPCPSPGHLSKPGIEPGYPSLQADSLPSESPGKFLSPDYINISYIVGIMYINLFLKKFFVILYFLFLH